MCVCVCVPGFNIEQLFKGKSSSNSLVMMNSERQSDGFDEAVVAGFKNSLNPFQSCFTWWYIIGGSGEKDVKVPSTEERKHFEEAYEVITSEFREYIAHMSYDYLISYSAEMKLDVALLLYSWWKKSVLALRRASSERKSEIMQN